MPSLVAVVLTVAACVPAANPTLLTSGPASREPGPTSAAMPSASTSPDPSQPPQASATPVAWTELEQTIQASIRKDAAQGCAPRRKDLPRGTIAAVECRPEVTAVARVGFYLFGSPEAASITTAPGSVTRGSSSTATRAGAAGRSAYSTYGEGEQKQLDCRQRHAGFVNKPGYSNYRAVWGSVYIGVLGKDADVQGMWLWAWESLGEVEVPPGEMGVVPEKGADVWMRAN